MRVKLKKLWITLIKVVCDWEISEGVFDDFKAALVIDVRCIANSWRGFKEGF
jgi:hypothetical protein